MAGSPQKRARREAEAKGATTAAASNVVRLAPNPLEANLPAVPREPGTPMDDTKLENLCQFLSAGGSLSGWARRAGRDASSALAWVNRDTERQRKYREARVMQAEAHIDQLIELADAEVPVDEAGRMDPAAVNNKRLQIDTRKWFASKLHPARYGDRVTVDANVNLSELPPERLLQDMTALLAANGLTVLPSSTSGDAHGPDGDQ